MNILVNISSADQHYKQYLNWLMSKRSMAGMITTKTLTKDDLYAMCKTAKCQGVLVCNPKTLENLVEYPKLRKDSKPTLDEFRGSRIMLGKSTPCIITNPLWHCHRVPHGRWLLESDMDKLHFKGWSGPKLEGEMIATTSRLLHVLEEITNSILCSVDIETNGEDIDKYYSRKVGKEERANGAVEVKPIFMTSISFTLLRRDGTIYSYAVPIVDYGREYWSEYELGAVFGFIRKAVATGAPLVMQNGIYDILHLIQYRAFPSNYFWDTMAMQHAWYAELPKSLDFLASVYCPDYHQWKFESKLAHADKSIEGLMLYNLKDTYWTLRVALHQIVYSPSWAKSNFLKNMKMVASSTYAHFEGMDVDNKVRLRELAKREQILEEARERMCLMVGDPEFNPGSWQQLEQLFYKTLWAVKPGIGKSKSCTDEKNLEAVAGQHPIFARMVKVIRDYKEQSKALGTYFRYLQRNGKLLYQLSPWGTETSRFASQASSFNCGTQVQNIPSYAKAQFVPPPGFTWINIDYSKMEAVLTAYIAYAPKLIAAVTDPDKDFYKTLGTLFFSIPYKEVTKDLRDKVLKKIVHGSNYMMQENTFIISAGADNLLDGAKELNIIITERPIPGHRNTMSMFKFANMLLEKYHEPFPEVRRWYAATKEQLLKTAKLELYNGWTRLFFGDAGKDHAVLRTAVAHQPQGSGAQYMRDAAFTIFRDICCNPDWIEDARYKGMVHDSWVGVVRTERLEEFLPLMRKHMMHSIVINGQEIRIPIDIEISTKSYKDVVELEYDDKLGKYILPDVF